MESSLYFALAGIALFIPIGAILGFVAFVRQSDQTSRIEELRREVQALRSQIAGVNGTPGQETTETVQTIPEPVPVAQVVHQEEPQTLEPATEPLPSRPPPKRLENQFFAALKENWMVWIGGLSVSLAGIFMVSHSISEGLIGPSQQLLLALLSGLLLHGGAEVMRRRHLGTDQVFAALAGGGSVTLYAALLAGVHHYELVSPVVALAGLAVVSLMTMALALVHGPLLAVMGLGGAYLVPLLVGGEGGSAAFILSYSFLITLSSALLMGYVFRTWLWFITLAGAVFWWLLAVLAYNDGLALACYVSALFMLFSLAPCEPLISANRRREAFLLLLLAWGASIALQYASQPLFPAWLVLLPVAILTPVSRGVLWYLPWGAVLTTALGWLAYAIRGSAPDVLLPLAAEHQAGLLAYLMIAAVITVLCGLWQWRIQLEIRRWPSLVMLSPVVWLVLGWLLVQGGVPSGSWALVALLAGAVYGALAWQIERRGVYRAGLVWAVLAAHACYSLAVVMWLREASLTLALSMQFVSLVWLARRYQASELYLVLKVALAVVVARLTFNPWLQSYDAGTHWSLWTYGGTTLFAAVATWLAGKNNAIRPWLEGASLHLLVLFLGTELRYWLYDGDIFAQEYSLTEAALNTLLWGSLGIVYVVRSRVSLSLVWLYRLFASALTVLSVASYLMVVAVHNPWWNNDIIGATPVFNMLLLAYGAPVLLALATSRFSDLLPRRWLLYVASAGFLLFTALEIRQLWQGSELAWWHGIGEGELYTYSVVGMVYSIAAILWSTRSGSAGLHKAGMALLGVVIAKIFLVDMSGLQGLWRVAAFMGLGLALLGLAWVYRRTRTIEDQAEESSATL